MARYDVCKLLAGAYKSAEEITLGRRALNLNQSQEKAVNILLDVLKLRSSTPLGGVQGPPGTGKTTVVESFVYNGVSDEIYNIDGIIVYIAPTNHLAAQAFERVVAALLARGYTFNDIIYITRLYGSKITVRNCAKIFEQEKIEAGFLNDSDVKQVVYGYIDPDIVKIVFATEYQRVSGRFTKKPGRIYLIVDEASKSPYYRAFISVADVIMRYEDYPHTLVALGDPEQAITVPEAFKIRNIPLLMPKIKQLLEENNMRDYFVMLDTTYRLPKPSEEPISYGFYEDKLRAYEPASFRLRELSSLFEDLRSRAESLIRRAIGWNTRLERVFYSIYDAVSTFRPLVIMKTHMFRSESTATTYDKTRTNLGILASLVLEAFLTEAERTGSYQHSQVMVTAPYSDIVTNVSFNYRQRFGYLTRQPRVTTVHAVIGGEADFVVTILGKEYSGSSYSYYWRSDSAYQTMYFSEPQVLNVQLSRHHKLLVVIGDIDRLASARHINRHTSRKLSGTAQRLLDLAKSEKAIIINMKT